MPIMLFLILILIFVILLVVVTNIVIVPQSKVYVIERLGSYSDSWSAGLHVKIPFVERVAKKVSLKEQVADFPPQPVITRDNVTMQIDTVVFFQVMDAKLYTYGVNQPIAAIESLSATTLRNMAHRLDSCAFEGSTTPGDWHAAAENARCEWCRMHGQRTLVESLFGA